MRLTLAKFAEGIYESYFREWKDETLAEHFNETRKLCEKLKIPALNNGSDDHVDCFRHLFTSAKLTRDYGPIPGKILADIGELFSWIRGFESTTMDINNNNLGIALGFLANKERWTDEQLAYKAKELMYASDSKAMLGLDNPKKRIGFFDFFGYFLGAIVHENPNKFGNTKRSELL